MKITLNEVEGILYMYRRDLATFATMDMQQDDIDYIEERLQYWYEIKKKLLKS